VTIDEKRTMVSDLAAKLYATGSMTSEQAAILAYASIMAFEEEWEAMSPQEQLRRIAEALVNRMATV
jgi:hypothetical protein